MSEPDDRDLLPSDTSGGAPFVPGFLKAAGRALLRATGLDVAWTLTTQGPLRSDGWLRSHREGKPVDADGRPLPWLTYPAIELLARRVQRDWQVFEYGCGQSTLWWAARVAHVIACEHDATWAARIRAELPANAEVLHVPLGNASYANASTRWPGRFDLIMVDGRERERCAAAALAALQPRGVIVWDNSERDEYRAGQDALLAAGFRKLPLVGMVPVDNQKSETGIFYRADNVLGL